MTFPAESVPDGASGAPHHLTWGVLGAVLVCLVVWDNHRHLEPIYTTVALALAGFAFLYIWPYYPAVGATLTLLGVAGAIVALLGPTLPWTHYPAWPHAICLLLVLVAADDAVSHAFGVWTPVDAAWSAFVLPFLT